MSDRQQTPDGHHDGTPASKRGWVSSRRGLLRTASGLAAVGMIGAGLAETDGARANEVTPALPDTGGQRDVVAGTPEFYVTIEGTRQGKFPKIDGFGFHYQAFVPIDPSTGQPTGKRVHKPIMMTKRWDASTIPLFQAFETNEMLKQVTFGFFAPDGGQSVDFFVKLTSASIASIEQYINFSAAGHQSTDAPDRLEDVVFTFQKVSITLNNQTTASTGEGGQ